MGKIRQGILGGVSGQVGNVIGGSWKGIDYVRVKPASVSNPNTTAQQQQRGAFSQVVDDARLLLSSVLQPYWDSFANNQSGFNRFISKNISEYDQNGLVTPGNIDMALGTLVGVAGLQFSSDSGAGEHDVAWDDNTGQADAQSTDEAVVVIYNQTQDYWLVEDSGTQRSNTGLVVTDSNVASNDSVYGYLFFKRPDVSKVSDSSNQNATAA